MSSQTRKVGKAIRKALSAEGEALRRRMDDLGIGLGDEPKRNKSKRTKDVLRDLEDEAPSPAQAETRLKSEEMYGERPTGIMKPTTPTEKKAVPSTSPEKSFQEELDTYTELLAEAQLNNKPDEAAELRSLIKETASKRGQEARSLQPIGSTAVTETKKPGALQTNAAGGPTKDVSLNEFKSELGDVIDADFIDWTYKSLPPNQLSPFVSYVKRKAAEGGNATKAASAFVTAAAFGAGLAGGDQRPEGAATPSKPSPKSEGEPGILDRALESPYGRMAASYGKGVASAVEGGLSKLGSLAMGAKPIADAKPRGEEPIPPKPVEDTIPPEAPTAPEEPEAPEEPTTPTAPVDEDQVLQNVQGQSTEDVEDDAKKSGVSDTSLEDYKNTIATALTEIDTAFSAQDQAALDQYKKEMADAYTIYQNTKDRQARAQLWDTIIKGLAKMAAGVYGMRNGLDLSGIEFDKVDWEAKAKQNMEELKQAQASAKDLRDFTRGMIEKNRDRSMQRLALNNSLVQDAYKMGVQSQKLEMDKRRLSLAEEAQTLEKLDSLASMSQAQQKQYDKLREEMQKKYDALSNKLYDDMLNASTLSSSDRDKKLETIRVRIPELEQMAGALDIKPLFSMKDFKKDGGIFTARFLSPEDFTKVVLKRAKQSQPVSGGKVVTEAEVRKKAMSLQVPYETYAQKLKEAGYTITK